MKKISLGLLLFAVMFAATSIGSLTGVAEGKAKPAMVCSKSAIDLKMDMRMLWEDHITWTRNYIISAIADLEDAGKVAERLLKNQDDIGDAIKPVYGMPQGRNWLSCSETI